MARKPSVVFCPGAWHLPSCFMPTVDLLSAAGYNTSLVSLPSVGPELRGEEPLQNWDADVAAVRATVLSHIDRGEDVVLVVHSYGGLVGSEAAKGLDRKNREEDGQGAIVAMVYLAALALDVGQSIFGAEENEDPNARTVTEGDLCYIVEPETWFYSKCSDEQKTELSKNVQSMSWKAFTSKVTYTAWRDIPSTYLLCENDQAIVIGMQETMVSAAGGAFKTVRCEADHSPFQSEPELTARVIRRAAGEEVGKM